MEFIGLERNFSNFYINLQLKLNDGTYTIFLATDCPKGKVPKELESFFTYVESGEGAAQEKREIAKNLKESGIPIDVISKNTGLSAEEVEAL